MNDRWQTTDNGPQTADDGPRTRVVLGSIVYGLSSMVQCSSSMVHRPWSIAPKSPHTAVFNLMAIMCHQSPPTARNGRFAPLSEPTVPSGTQLLGAASLSPLHKPWLTSLIDCVLYEAIRSNLTNLSGPLQAAGGWG